MNQEENDDAIQDLLRAALPPMNRELRRDLWPLMLRRLDLSGPAVPWYDWALIGGLAGILVSFPSLILLLAYHF